MKILVNAKDLRNRLKYMMEVDKDAVLLASINHPDSEITFSIVTAGVSVVNSVSVKLDGVAILNEFSTPLSNLYHFSTLCEDHEEIELNINKTIMVKAGLKKAKFPLFGTSLNFIPSLVDEEETPHAVMTVDDYTSIKYMSLSVAQDDGVFSGIYFKVSGDKVILLSTNKTSMVHMELPLSEETELEYSIVVPTSLFLKIDDDIETVRLFFNNNQIYINFGETWVISQGIAGEYPADRMLGWLEKDIVRLFSCEPSQVKVINSSFKVINAGSVVLYGDESGVGLITKSKDDNESSTLDVRLVANQEKDEFSYILSPYYTKMGLELMSKLNIFLVDFFVTDDVNSWIFVQPTDKNNITVCFARYSR